jgi:hypothetical protein
MQLAAGQQRHEGRVDLAGGDQADFFLSTVGSSPETLLALDFEANPSVLTLSTRRSGDMLEPGLPLSAPTNAAQILAPLTGLNKANGIAISYAASPQTGHIVACS